VPTLVVNVLGCLAFGVCWACGGTAWSRPVAAGVFVGFLGAFTTFSTFAFDVTQLWAEERANAAILLVLGHNVLGMLAMLLGLWLGRTLLAR
jgi:CrcB protein